MGLVTAVIFTPILVTGVVFGSPLILSTIGLSVAGPVAGGMFAAAQGAGIVSGTWMAVAQGIAMTAVLPTP